MRLPHILLTSLLLALTAPTLLAAASDAALPTTWNPHSAVRFALANSPDSSIGRQRLAAAQAAIDLERAALKPQLNLSSQYSQTNTPMYSFGNILNQGAFANTIDFNDPGRTDSASAGLQVGYRLYDGGRSQAGVQAASAQAEAAQQDLAVTQTRLAYEVVRAFYAITQAQGFIQANQAAVEAAEASLNVARARQEAGVLLLDAVLDLEVQHSRATENLIQAQEGLRVAKKVFLTLLGVEAKAGAIALETGGDPDTPGETAMGERFELKALDAQLAAAQARVRQGQAGNSPTVDGFAGYQAEYGTVTGGSGDAWQAGVKVQYALADGGRTQAEVARGEAQVAELKAQRQKLELGIDLEVEQARSALRETDGRLRVTEKTVAQARESADINRSRFVEGVVLSSDLIAVENRLTEAMIRRTMAQTARRVAVADLRRALGLPQFDDLADCPANMLKKQEKNN